MWIDFVPKIDDADNDDDDDGIDYYDFFITKDLKRNRHQGDGAGAINYDEAHDDNGYDDDDDDNSDDNA